MAKFQVQNNIRLLLDAPVSPSDTQLTVQKAIAPDQEPTLPTGGEKLHLTLVDNFGSPSVTEIVNVTDITDNTTTLTLTVERAQEGTSAQSFSQGFVFQAATAAVLDSKQDADDAQAFFDRTDNPHNVTKAQVGLGDVDNVTAANLRDRTTHTGEQAVSTITGLQDALDDKANLVSGKVPVSELPAITVSATHVVADLTARDALAVEEGDVAIVQDTGSGEPASYIYDGAQWQELLTPIDGVTDVSASGALHSTGGNTPEITLKDGGVTEQKIENSAVTNDKLAGGIAPSKIVGTAVTDNDPRLIDQREPTDESVTDSKIDPGGLSPTSVAGTAVVDVDARLVEGAAGSQTVRSLGTGSTQALPGDFDVAGQAPVQSVAAKTGNVTLASSDVSLGNVPNLDTTDAVNKAHDQNTDTALDQGGANETTASEVRAHIDSTDNPHGVTKAQVGLSDVDNVSAADLRDRSTHTGTQALSTISDAGTIASQDANSVNIDGGAIDGVTIGGASAGSGAFTTLDASGDVNFDSGTLFVDASSGNVGIGTTAPSDTNSYGRALDIQSAQGGATYCRDSDDTSKYFLSGYNGSLPSGVVGTWGTGTNLRFYSSGNERMRIDSSGKILAATGGGWVGTVSENGQSSVIERGSNANGEFVRFADGTMICYLNAESYNSLINQSYGKMFRSGMRVVNLPATFVDTNYKITTNEASNSGIFHRVVGSTNSSIAIGKLWTNSTSFFAPTNADTTVVGRWY